MYDLVTKEIPEVLKAADLGLVRPASDSPMRESTFVDIVGRTGPECRSSVTPWEVSLPANVCSDNAQAIGHGALMLYFKNPGMYKSASAFAPAWQVFPSPMGMSWLTPEQQPLSHAMGEERLLKLHQPVFALASACRVARIRLEPPPLAK